MPFTKFSNLDFDQIKTSIKDYLRSNSNFSDFDFEGSNFSVLIDTLAYNTYITAFNTNMAVNESFLDSATVRRNVVSLASNIGYLPRSRKASKATISFSVTPDNDSDFINVVLQPIIGNLHFRKLLWAFSKSGFSGKVCKGRIKNRLSELPQETDIILIIITDVINTLKDHGDTLDTHTKGVAGVGFRINVHGLKDFRVNHPATHNLQPAIAQLTQIG